MAYTRKTANVKYRALSCTSVVAPSTTWEHSTNGWTSAKTRALLLRALRARSSTSCSVAISSPESSAGNCVSRHAIAMVNSDETHTTTAEIAYAGFETIVKAARALAIANANQYHGITEPTDRGASTAIRFGGAVRK